MSPRPGRIQPRSTSTSASRTDETRESPEFFKKITEVREALRGTGASPSSPVRSTDDDPRREADENVAVASRFDGAARMLMPLAFGVAAGRGVGAVLVVFDVQPFLLPKPSAIWRQLLDNHDDDPRRLVVTGGNALFGLVVGAVLGIGAALLTARFRLPARLLPVAAAVNALPIIALAPILNNMFDGSTDESPAGSWSSSSCSSPCSSTSLGACPRSTRPHVS